MLGLSLCTPFPYAFVLSTPTYVDMFLVPTGDECYGHCQTASKELTIDTGAAYWLLAAKPRLALAAAGFFSTTEWATAPELFCFCSSSNMAMLPMATALPMAT